MLFVFLIRAAEGGEGWRLPFSLHCWALLPALAFALSPSPIPNLANNTWQ